jgi:hypothetical protein
MNKLLGMPPPRDEDLVIRGKSDLLTMAASTADGMVISNTVTAYLLNRYATGDALPELTQGDHYLPMEQEESQQFQILSALIFKVLFFAAIPDFKPAKTLDNASKKEGGKFGFRGRPKTPRYRVVYLPRHIQQKQRDAEEAMGRHAFFGRRGHMRVYKADRYVHMKGQKQFIAPVPAPDGSVPRRQFKIQKHQHA